MNTPSVDTPEWAAAWLEFAERPREYDRRLGRLWERKRFTPDDVATVIGWKLKGSYGPRHVAQFRRADRRWAADAVARAFSLKDDLAALMTLTALPGVGVPVASAILTVHDPFRYTIADLRAWKTIQGPLKSLSGYDGRTWEECWLAYLDVCRGRQRAWRMSLRQVDHVLYFARGRFVPERRG